MRIQPVIGHPNTRLLHLGSARGKGEVAGNGVEQDGAGLGRVIPYWPKDGDYMHELHHRYYTVNFGGLSFPLDKLLNTFHDGSPESHQEMLDRRKAKAKKARPGKSMVAAGE